jgi:hypothetical protein
MDDRNEPLVLESLESPNSIVQTASASPPPDRPSDASSSKRRRLVYGSVAAFVMLLLLVGGFVFLTNRSKANVKRTTNVTINTQSLSSSTLQRLTATVPGSTNASEELQITANSLFEHNLTVAGLTALGNGLQVTGNLTDSANGSFGGNLSVGGYISANSLNVSSLSLSALRLSGDANLGGHIITGGSAPTIQAEAAGGSVEIEGNDTSGTLTFNSSDSTNQPANSELATVTFHNPYATNPRVQLTPVNAAAASLEYYVNQSIGFFSLETVNAPAAGTRYSFNYFVTQ